jgi:DNA-binding response OmpR family regulator
VDDVVLDTAGPAEVEARLRLAVGRRQLVADDSPMEIRNGDLSVDEATYSAKLKGRVLDLTFKEFELLKTLVEAEGVCSAGMRFSTRCGAMSERRSLKRAR